MRIALRSRQSLAEVESWDDSTLATVLAEFTAQDREIEEARRGR